MLEFLVTSRVRRRLLWLLFAENASGATSDFAERAHVGYASAYRELRAMVALGLVCSTRAGKTEVFAANDAHPVAGALRTLIAAEASPPQEDRADDETRNALFTLGAPTFGEEVPVEDPEYAIVQGVNLAHRDGTVASVLPVCLYKQRERLSPEGLERYARQFGEKRSLGFLLDLTSELSGDPRFSTWARALRDRRWRDVRYFFNDDARTPLSRQIAERNTPQAARKWKLRANASKDSFASMFMKHANA